MPTEPEPAASDHPAPSQSQLQEVERKPRSEAKHMEAETVAPPVKESVKHEESAAPSTESEAEPLPVNERVEGDIKTKAEGSVDVATSLAEPVQIKALELFEKQELPVEAAIEAKDVTGDEFKVEEVSQAAPTVEEKTSEKAESILEEKVEKEVPAEAVKTIGAKGVTEDECKAEGVSSAAPTVEENQPCEKSGVIEAEPLGEVELKSQTLPKEEVSGATGNPTIRVEEKEVECYPTEEVEERTGEEKEPPAKEIIEVKEKVSDPGTNEATSEEKSGATEEFVQIEENPTNDANMAEDEVTDRDIKLIVDNAKTEAHTRESSEETEKDVAADTIKETVQATEEKIEATVGAIKAEFEGEKQVESVNDTKSTYPLPEPIVENAKTEVGNKEAIEETDTNEAADKIKETILATEKKIEENVGSINPELEEENQVDEPELIVENAKTEADNKESSDELEKNVAAESINETVKATDEKIEETVGAIKAELDGEKQVDEPVQAANFLPEPLVENAKTEADYKETSSETETNVAAEEIKERVQASEEKIEEAVGTIKADGEGEKQVEEIAHPFPELIAESVKTEADNKESSDEPEKNVAARSIKEMDEKVEETVGAIIAELDGEKQVGEPVHDTKYLDHLPEPIAENAETNADNKEASEETDKNVAGAKIKESVQATEEKIEETIGTIKAEVEGQKQVEEPVNDEKCSGPFPEPIAEIAKTEADSKGSSDEPEKNVAAESIKETDEKIEETVGTIKAEVEGEKQAEGPVNDAKCSDSVPEIIVDNAITESDNKESSDELEINVAARSIKETDEKIEATVRTIKAEVEGEKQVEEPVNDAKCSDYVPEIIVGNAKTESDNTKSSEETEKNVTAESIKETDEKIEESVGTIKAEVEGEKQAEESVNDAKCSDSVPEIIVENAIAESDNKESSEETEKNVTAESIKETDEKIEESVGTIKAEVEGEKQAEESVNDAKCSDSVPEIIVENAIAESDNKESSDDLETNVAARSIKETDEKIEATVGTIKAEVEGEKQAEEPVNDAKCSDSVPEIIVENAITESDNKESSDDLETNVAARSIKETDEKIEAIVGTIKAEVEGEKQAEEPVDDAKCSDSVPEIIVENAITESDNKESSDELETNVAARSIKETDEKIEETVGTIKAEVEGEKQVEEPVNDAKCTDSVPEIIEENAKTQSDNKVSIDEPEKNVAAESIKETDEKIEETFGTIKAEEEGEKQAEEPVNDAKCSDSVPEIIVENAKTETDNKESSDEPEKNVAAESIKETDEKIEETVGTIKAEVEGEKQVEEPVNDARCSDSVPELEENAKTEAEETVGTIKAEVEGEKQVEEPVNDAKCSDSVPELEENAKTEAEETFGTIKAEVEGEKQVEDPVNDAKCSDSVPELEENAKTEAEETFGTIKAEVEGEKQVEEPVNDAKSSDSLPQLISDNAKTEADNKESSDELEKNEAAESIKVTEDKNEETVGSIKAEFDEDKQGDDSVYDAKTSDTSPECIAENAKTEADNVEASEETDKNVAAEKIKESIQATEEKIEETVGTIKPEEEGEKQVEEPVNDARSSDSLAELVAGNAKTEADNKESSDELEKNVSAESIKETDERIKETAELDGEKQVDEPVHDTKSSDPLPEPIAENVKTKADSKESNDEPEKNVAAECIKETDERIGETVGAIKAELDEEKQVDEPVHDAKNSDPLPELIAEYAKTEAVNMESSDEPEKNVAAMSMKGTVQATEEKVEETAGAIKADLGEEKQVEEPINVANSSRSLPEHILQIDKTAADNNETSEAADKNVATKKIKESEQATEEKIDETARTFKAEPEGEKQVDEPVKNPERAKEIEDTKKPQDVPVKTHKQSIVKMVKQSLVKAKNAITGKSHNSKTQASEPKDEGT